MPKILKYFAIAVAAIVALLVIGVGIIAATFDPNHYKPELIKLVQEKQQRTLTIPGDITLSVFPKLGADLGKITISERNSTDEFASIDSAKLSLALIPLLSKQFVVDQVHIDGLRASIRKNKNGSTNFDDFVSTQKKDEPAQEVKFDIDSVDINNAYLLYDDQQAQRRLELVKLNLKTGKIANGVPGKLNLNVLVRANAPEVNASVAVKSGFTIDLEQKHYILRGLDAEVRGNFGGFTDALMKLAGDVDMRPNNKQMALDGIKLSLVGKRTAQSIDAKFDIPKLHLADNQFSSSKIGGEAKLVEGTRIVNAVFAAPSLTGSSQAFKLPAITLDAIIKDTHTQLDARAKLSGDLSGDLDKMLFRSPQLSLALSGKQGEGSNSIAINGTLTTPLSANMQSKLIELPAIAASFNLPNPGGGALALTTKGDVRAELDKENLNADLKGKLDDSNFDATLGLTAFSPLAYAFKLDIDRIDLDRYQSKADNKLASKSAQADKPIDLAMLKDLNASGSVRIGALKVANIRTTNLRATLHAADGKLDISPLAANLYGGSVNGQLALTSGKPMHIATKQNLVGVQVGPLLKDAMQKDPILEGKGNVQLDVNTSGGAIAQFKKSLNGTARIALHEGSVKGINVAQTIRGAQAKLGALGGGGETQAQAQTGTGSAGEKTDFSELTGSFRITNGVAHNDDLSIKSPLLRVGGNGDINIGEDRLDYVVKATVVSSLKGQGGPELQALRGVTIPVKLSGPYTAMSWHVDVAGMAGALAKQKLDEQKEALKSKAQKQIQDGLGNGLKGLFGR
jgi:AsmA protein